MQGKAALPESVASAKWVIEEERKKNGKPGEKYGGPVSLVMYVHGWKNNANERKDGSGDVARFKSYLVQYHDSMKPEFQRPIVGIYVGWHGRSLELPSVISWISFWTRSAGARRVGRGKAITQDMMAFAELARRRGGPQTTDASALLDLETTALSEGRPTDVSRRSRVVVLGHSFGARVLETVLADPKKDKSLTLGICKGLRNKQSQRSLADLILFENAATGSRDIRRQFDQCQPCGSRENGCGDVKQDTQDFSKAVMVRSPQFDRDYCHEHPNLDSCQPFPLMASVSAKNDVCTRVVLFIATGARPAAFTPWLQTHRVRTVPGASTVDRGRGDAFQFRSVNGTTYKAERIRTNRIIPTNPIWSMKVDKEIIDSHGGVWGPNLLEFQIQLMGAGDETVLSEHLDVPTRKAMASAKAQLR